MEKMLLFLCLFGVAPFAKGAWVPEAESLDPQNPKCIDILQQLANGNDTSIDLDPVRNFTPSEWDPLKIPYSLSYGSGRCGITEQSKLAQSFLCNLNDKRSSALLTQLKWHYGLAFLAEAFEPCDEYPPKKMSSSGCFGMQSCARVSTKFIGGRPTNQRAYESIEKWFGNYYYYRYPISGSTGQPAGYRKCSPRNGGGTSRIDKFARIMWSEAEYIGCAWAECSPTSGQFWNYNCIIATNSSSYDISDLSRPAFDRNAQIQIDINYGLPLCFVP
ncbi:uncharacterized protein LOC142354076 [Convolutriloba macropyga]|uniref:uncharacterized protein LOC142354076 n=1 Tax=Convolutriloba macropyga TaxID=536237 RepID=UPI003F51F711